jgi:hypothetical protein
MALALTAGCSSMTRVELARDGIAGLRTIDLVMPPEPGDYVVAMENHPGAAVGGVIGGVIIAADQTAKMDRVKHALEGQRISISRTMADALVQRLKATGYRVRLIEAPLERQSISPSVNVASVESDADALLVVTPRTIGFVSANAFTAYEPTVMVEVRNVASRRTFADVDGLIANPAATAAALTEAGTDVARAIADDIRLSAASPAVAARRSRRG